MASRLPILALVAAVVATAAPRILSTAAVAVLASSPGADVPVRGWMALDAVGAGGSPPDSAPPFSLSTTARVLTPLDLRGTYSAVYTLRSSGAPCPRSFAISRGAPVVDAVDETKALRFKGHDLAADGAACGTSTSVVAVATGFALSVSKMESLGMPNGTRRLRASDLVDQFVDWASVVGFNVGTLSCGLTAPWDAETLALWGDAALNLTIQDPEAVDAVAEVVRLAAGHRHLIFMVPRTPLCVLSADPLSAAIPVGGDGGGGGADGGLSPGVAAAVAAGVVGATAIAAAVAVWEYRRRGQWRRGATEVGKGEPPPAEAAWAGAPPPPPSPLGDGRPELFPSPPPPAVAYPSPSSWDDDTRRSSSVPTSAALGSRPSSTATQRDSSTGSGAPPSSRGSGSNGSGRDCRDGGGVGAGRASQAYSDASSGRTPGDEASSNTAAAATSPVMVDDLWPTWDSKLTDE